MVGYEPELTIEKAWERRLQHHNLNSPRPLTKPYHLRSGSCFDYEGELATPLVQVFSVHISTDFDDGKPCEIYGSIRALEGLRPRFHLYNRDPEDSETIWKQGNLSLIGPDSNPIVPSLSTKLELCLYDRIRGVKVVDNKLNLDPINDDSYDRLIKHQVRGPHVCADVYYVVFQFAAYATLHVKVTKNDNADNNFNAADIYGSVVTGYENVRRYCSSDLDVERMETRVFDKPSHQPLRVLLGVPIKLSRKVVAVPAYSSITIQVNLWHSNGKIAGGCLQSSAYNRGDSFLRIQTQHACVEVRVQWDHAFLYLYRDRKMLLFKEKGLSNEQEEMQKKQKLLYEQQPSSSTLDIRSIPRSPLYFRDMKVEIFTVFVDGVAQKISALCGAILIDDGGNKFSIYNRDDDCMEVLSDSNFASIDFNFRAIQNDEWVMILYLRDPVNNLEVSKGSFSWNVCSLESSVPYHNKRLCSVVRGDDGFAVVHYQILSDAYEAFVTVKLVCHGNTDIHVYLHGNLFGRYSDHDYSTSYQKKYYRSRLFDLPRNKAVELKSGSEIALIKSIVAVPGDADLIIEADLGVFGIDGVGESICGMAEFEFDLDEPYRETIRGEHYCLEFSVSFKETNLFVKRFGAPPSRYTDDAYIHKSTIVVEIRSTSSECEGLEDDQLNQEHKYQFLCQIDQRALRMVSALSCQGASKSGNKPTNCHVSPGDSLVFSGTSRLATANDRRPRSAYLSNLPCSCRGQGSNVEKQ
ncbi:hypothetical protein KSS87_002024 [Heliosperma pusillum]|nr:hypothetical protein KSS87_002024 [Heliosperma pusillum]